jgi:cyanophycinase
MVIGGAEDKLRDKAILSRFAKFAGGPEGRVVVISTASSLGDQATEMYRELFLALGLGEVTGLRPEEREEADDPAAVSALQGATGVYLTGGNQSRLASVWPGHGSGTLSRARSRGGAGGRRPGERHGLHGALGRRRRRRTAWRSFRGLGILQGLVIDQHFEQRGRIGRLLAIVAGSPSLLGVGFDADTRDVHADQTIG